MIICQVQRVLMLTAQLMYTSGFCSFLSCKASLTYVLGSHTSLLVHRNTTTSEVHCFFASFAGGEIVGGTRVVAGGGCSRYEQKRRAAGWAPCQSDIQATLGLLIHAQSRTGVLQYDLLRFYLPHASAPLDAQVFFVSHCLCTCANPSNFRACMSFWLLGTTQLDYYSTVYW